MRPPLSSTAIEIIVGPIGKQARAHLLAAVRAPLSPDSSSTIVAERLDQRPRLAREGREQAVAGKGLVGLVEFVDRRLCHLPVPDGRHWRSVTERPAFTRINASQPKLLHHMVTARIDRVRRPASRQSATSRSGATSTRLRRSSIRSTNVAVDIRIFAGPVVGAGFAIRGSASRRRLPGELRPVAGLERRSSIPRLRCGASRGWRVSGPSASGLEKTILGGDRGLSILGES